MAVEWLTSGWTGSVASYAGTENNDAGSGMTLGTTFSPVKAGFITQIRFWKVSIDSETSRTVGIYSGAGTLLTSQVTSGEPIGVAQWVTIVLTTPVATVDAAAGTNLMVAAVGHAGQKYPATIQVFGNGTPNGHSTFSTPAGALYSMGDGETGALNGRFHEGGSAFQFPDTTFQSSWYWVDVGWEASVGGGGGTKKAKQQVLPQSLGRLGL